MKKGFTLLPLSIVTLLLIVIVTFVLQVNKPAEVEQKDKTPITLINEEQGDGGLLIKTFKVPSTPTYSYKTYTIKIPQDWTVESDIGDRSGEQNIYLKNVNNNLIWIEQPAIGGETCFFNDTDISDSPTPWMYDGVDRISDYEEVDFENGTFRRYVSYSDLISTTYAVCDDNHSPLEENIFYKPTKIGVINAIVNNYESSTALNNLDLILSQIRILD